MNFWLKLLSLPSWERGLKHIALQRVYFADLVAPFVGAWIETGGSGTHQMQTMT